MPQALTLRHALDSVGGALALDARAFFEVQQAPWGLALALVVVLAAGLSQALGQSIVLFANRVKKRRFVLSLWLFAVFYAFGFLFWTASVWLVGTQLFGREANFRAVAQAVGMGYSPYLFSFFVLTPYFGVPIATLLSLWSLLAILVAVQVTLQLTLMQALLCSALGWLLWQLLQRTVGRPLLWLARALRRRVSGVPLVTDRRKLQELLQSRERGEEG
jgi:hypothetical protein